MMFWKQILSIVWLVIWLFVCSLHILDTTSSIFLHCSLDGNPFEEETEEEENEDIVMDSTKVALLFSLTY